MLKQIEWWVRNGPIKKNVVLPVTTLFFSKFCFRLITTSKEFIWCSSDSNLHIHTFYKRCSFIWQCFFPVSIVNKQFFCFGFVTSKLRSFCDQVNETVIHIFAECSATKPLYDIEKTYSLFSKYSKFARNIATECHIWFPTRWQKNFLDWKFNSFVI